MLQNCWCSPELDLSTHTFKREKDAMNWNCLWGSQKINIRTVIQQLYITTHTLAIMSVTVSYYYEWKFTQQIQPYGIP